MGYEEKLREHFQDRIVFKSPDCTRYFESMSYPSYLRDWLVMKFDTGDGTHNYPAIEAYIKRMIPRKDSHQELRYRLTKGEAIQLLARLRLSVDIKRGVVNFFLPDYGLEGVVAQAVLDAFASDLLRESEQWGLLTLQLANPEEELYAFGESSASTVSDSSSQTARRPIRLRKGEILLEGFKPFRPYRVDLEAYCQARQAFTTEEWLDVLISAVDYNPSGYVDASGAPSERQKCYFLRRLLPFVERRLNLMELAPKGTGKSYVYAKISKRGWMISGGSITRASLFYDNKTKTPGLLSRFDFVAFDEVQSIEFKQEGEIQTALKSYMEFGEIKGFDAQLPADVGIVILGNVDAKRQRLDANYVRDLNPIFRESALLDRFHGFIPGWEIPRFRTDLAVDGWGLNTEYFAEILHELRHAPHYGTIVDECLLIPRGADQRDTTAIRRLTIAFLKLLFPQVKSRADIDPEAFTRYCLKPALEMRGAIRQQLHIIDPGEYVNVLPDIRCRT